MIYDGDIKNLSVRLEIERESGEKECIGSGVIWTPSKSSEYTYIFTAAHVVNDYLNEDLKFVVRYYDMDGKISYNILEKENIEVHKQYKKRSNSTERDINDIAVIRSKKINCKKISYNFYSPNNVKKEANLVFNGFPKKLSSLEFEINRNEYFGYFDSVINESEAFKYKLGIENALDVSMKNEDLLGVSGSGVFLKGENNISLIGIHTHGVGEDLTMNMAIGMSIKLILDVCISRKWDKPIISEDYKNDYKDYINELSINNKKILDDINFISRDIINVESGISINIENIINDNKQYILLEEPGGGKSCVIQSLCYYVTKSNFHKIPIILKLQGYGLNFKDIRDGILKILSQYNEFLKIDEVNNLIKKGRLVIFFDGLDEVRQESYNKCILEIKDLLNYNKKNKYIIACRSNRYNKEFEFNVVETKLKELDEYKIRKYLYRKQDNIYIPKLEKRVINIVKNPLLLSIFYNIINSNSGYTPKSRVDLYNEFLKTLIHKWNEKQSKVSISLYMKIEIKNIFTHIAYRTFKMNEFGLDFLYKLVYEVCKDKSKVENILDYILNLGILESINNEVVWFKHKTYKEYFSARYIMKIIEDKYNFIKDIINNDEWSEVLIFIAGMFDDWEEQNIYLDLLLENNFKLYIECVKEKNDLSKSLKSKSDSELCYIYLNTMVATYEKIVNKYFNQIKYLLNPFRYYSNYNEMKLVIKGNLLEQRHLTYKYSLQNEGENVIICDYKLINKKELGSRGQNISFIDINLSNLDLDSARYLVLKSLKKELLSIMNKRSLFSPELICERVEYLKRRIGIDDNKKILDMVNIELKKYPNLRRYMYKNVDIIDLANKIAFLANENIKIEEHILPKGDIDINKNSYSIWEVYSKERLVQRISKFFELYKRSIIYILENSFSGIKGLLPCYRNLPYQYTVKYYFDKDYLNGIVNEYYNGPGGLSYYYEPCESNDDIPKLIECNEDDFGNDMDDINTLMKKYYERNCMIEGLSITNIRISELLHNESLSKFIHSKIEKEIKFLFDGIGS